MVLPKPMRDYHREPEVVVESERRGFRRATAATQRGRGTVPIHVGTATMTSAQFTKRVRSSRAGCPLQRPGRAYWKLAVGTCTCWASGRRCALPDPSSHFVRHMNRAARRSSYLDLGASSDVHQINNFARNMSSPSRCPIDRSELARRSVSTRRETRNARACAHRFDIDISTRDKEPILR
jgi:hypothetical protein